MITGIHHLSMKCGSAEDFARAKDFYCRILGFSVVREWPEGIMLETGRGQLEIFRNGPGIRTKGAIRHVAFACDDVDETALSFAEIKAPGKQLRPLQQQRVLQFIRMGFRVYVVDSVEKIGGVIREIRAS